MVFVNVVVVVVVVVIVQARKSDSCFRVKEAPQPFCKCKSKGI